MAAESVLTRQGAERGAALITVAAVLGLVAAIGVVAVQTAGVEGLIAGRRQQAATARHLAEAGLELVLEWFHDPSAAPAGAAHWFERPFRTPAGAWSYLDAAGESLFRNPPDAPDWAVAPDLGPAWSEIGVLEAVRLSRPTLAGAICTVEAVGRSRGGARATAQMQLEPAALPLLTAAVNLAASGSGWAPIRAHWGDVEIGGDARLAATLDAIPRKDPTAPANGAIYGPGSMADAWLDIWIAGRILAPGGAACGACAEPFAAAGYAHLHQGQTQIATGAVAARLDYQRLKALARRHGVLLVPDDFGGLHGEDGRPADFAAELQAGRLVVINTRDGSVPNGRNGAVVHLAGRATAGVGVVFGSLDWNPVAGAAVAALPPAAEGMDGFGAAVELSGINQRGALLVTERLSLAAPARLYGALAVGQGIDAAERLEVWYDAALARGEYPGLPRVIPAHGTWRVE